jgi:hypothetical protein
MSALVWWIVLLAVATAVDGLLAGASLGQSIKQLPARHRIGVVAFSAYSQAADLGNGVVWYATLGIGGALLTLASATFALVLNAPQQPRRLLLIASVLAIAHSITRARAAPLNFSQRAAQGKADALREIFARFERLQMLRSVLQLATFALVVWALATATS